VPDRPGDMDERDVEARFASIVAQWNSPLPDVDQLLADDDPEVIEPGADPTDHAVADAPADDPEADAGKPAAPPVTPRLPWVNPSPLDVVVPASSWRAAEPTEPADPGAESAVEKAAAEDEAVLDEEHFEPPEVELPPQEDLHFWGAVIGLVAGPLMLLWVVFARPSHSTRWFFVSVVVSLLGFGLLILRQPTHRDPTSGDDGARV